MKTNDGESLSSLLLLRENGSSTITEKLYEKLKLLIITGQLTPGSALPNENEMCQMLQIGRGTLREAYQILATNGLITRTKVGTYINDRSTIINFAPLSIVSELADYDDILNFRMMFEKECARAAAESITAEELKQLGEIINESSHATESKELSELDYYFHQAVVEYSHNPLLINLFPSVWNSFQSMLSKCKVWLYALTPEKTSNNVTNHARIYEALEARDAVSAMNRMEEHLLDVYKIPKSAGVN